MENAVLVAIGFVAAVSGGLAVALWYAGRSDPARAEVVQLGLAAVARAVNGALGDAEVEALASWAYDWFGVSEYYSREAWIAFVLRRVRGAETDLAAGGYHGEL